MAVYEECAAQRLAQTTELGWTRLFPESPVLQIVAVNGVVVGQIRRSDNRWLASGIGLRGPVADCGTFRNALGALASESNAC